MLTLSILFCTIGSVWAGVWTLWECYKLDTEPAPKREN